MSTPRLAELRSTLSAARERVGGVSAVVLVEGVSDANALHAAAAVRGLDLEGAGVLVAPMGGITNLEHFVRGLRSESATAGSVLSVLCDAGEGAHVAAVLARTGGHVPVAVCREDLEDELVRALGPERVEAIVAAEGDLRAFRSLQGQREWRGMPTGAQLRRFLGSGSGRKIRYGALLTDAMRPEELPAPLIAALAVAQRRSSR